MINLKKAAAAAVSVSLASTLFGCTPAIGSNTKTALTIEGQEIPAGVFLYYTLEAYNEASDILKNKNGSTPEPKEVRNSNIDSLDSTDWIQNKATDYCRNFAAIYQEFESLGLELSLEDKDTADSTAEYIYASEPLVAANGVSLDTLKNIMENSYREKAVFEYYYGFEGEDGCTEEELKTYFDDNFARMKTIVISLKDSEGNRVTEDEVRKRRQMAKDYAEEINSKKTNQDKLNAVNDLMNEYSEYESAQTTTAEGAATTTTTTTTTAAGETTTTTTTGAHDNERLIQRNTTTAASEESEDTETEHTEAEISQNKFNDYLFNLALNKAEVYDYDSDTIYVVIRGDLRERMTADDYWSKDYISRIQSMRYYDLFAERIEKKEAELTIEKNKAAYRRYSPFKLDFGTM